MSTPNVHTCIWLYLSDISHSALSLVPTCRLASLSLAIYSTTIECIFKLDSIALTFTWDVHMQAAFLDLNQILFDLAWKYRLFGNIKIHVIVLIRPVFSSMNPDYFMGLDQAYETIVWFVPEKISACIRTVSSLYLDISSLYQSTVAWSRPEKLVVYRSSNSSSLTNTWPAWCTCKV